MDTNSAFDALKAACATCNDGLEACGPENLQDDDEKDMNAIVEEAIVMVPKFGEVSHSQMIQRSKKTQKQKSVHKQEKKVNNEVKQVKTVKQKIAKKDAQTSKKKNTSAQTSKGKNTSAQTKEAQQVHTNVPCTNAQKQQLHHTESPDFVPECTQKMQLIRHKGVHLSISETENKTMKNAASRAYHSALKTEMNLTSDPSLAYTAAQVAHRKVVEEHKDKFLARHQAVQSLEVDEENAADVY